MADDLRTHVFDVRVAVRYRPDSSFAKTAILVQPFESDAVTVICAPFGKQVMQGSFYVVAEEAGSYGASRREFEATHEEVGPNRWVKSGSVLAYRSSEACLVETRIGEICEANVIARPGDWIVRQHGGEVIVVKPEEFAVRYVVADQAGCPVGE